MRQLSVAIVAVVGMALTGLAVHVEQTRQAERFQHNLEWRAVNEAGRFQRSLERALEVADGLGSFFAASDAVERDEFGHYVQHALRMHPEIRALEWLPRVPHAERARFEAELARLAPGLRIHEPDADGRPVSARPRAEYFPIFYAEPQVGNAAALGLDAAARALSRQAMEQARDEGRLVVSAAIRLVQGGQGPAVVAYRPVYRRGLPIGRVDQRRAALLGFSVAVIEPRNVLAAALRNVPPTGLDVHLLDESAAPDGHVLFVHASRARARGEPPVSLHAARSSRNWQVPIQVPGRQWTLLFSPSPAFEGEFAGARPPAALWFGVLLTGLVVFYQLRRLRYEARLAEAAAGLTEANRALVERTRRLDEAQALAHVGSWELDMASGRMLWSDEALRILELDPVRAGPAGPAFLERVHPQDRERVEQAYAASVAGRTPYQSTHRLLLPDGRVKHVLERGETSYDAAGRPLRSIGTLQDVSEQRQAEAQLRLAASVFANTHEGVVITDAQGDILDVNQAFITITGYTRAEVIGRNPRLWKSQHHDAAFYAGIWEALARSGSWQGEIWNRRRSGEAFPVLQTISAVHDEGGTLTHYVSVFSDISGIKDTEAQLVYLAQHDPLTDLPNRMLFRDRLDQALRRAERDGLALAVMFLDLDRFKHINDSLGHAVGDRLLQEVAQRLRDALRREDSVARMGGDEFILLVEHLHQEQDAAQLAGKVLRALADPYRIDGHELYVTASIGISLYPHDGVSAEALVSNADAAMYRAKHEGRDTYQFYTEKLTTAALERVHLEVELRRAIEAEELSVHYQPQVDLASGQLVGAEALVRWCHPDWGDIPPDRFLPTALDTGLIIPLGEWVLRQACRQASAWRAAGLRLENIAVNVAAPQILRNDFVATVRRALADTGLAAENLELEVTEGFIMDQTGRALAVLEELGQLGVALSIDDFGTGYSSLAYLKRLPIDTLKLDRSFVHDLPGDEEDAAIAGAVIALGHSLGLRVIAEGVETREQAGFLLGLGCDEAQGYYYGRPMTATEFAAAMAGHIGA